MRSMGEFIDFGKPEEIPPGKARCRDVGKKRIAVFNVDGEFFAIDDTCTHAEASLSDGWLDGCVANCPLHGAQFDLKSGQSLAPPAFDPVKTYRVVVAEDSVRVEV